MKGDVAEHKRRLDSDSCKPGEIVLGHVCGWDLPLQARLFSDFRTRCCVRILVLFLMASVAKLVVPLYPFSMSHEGHPYKTNYASQDVPIRISEVDYCTVRSYVAREES
jgi:hypothetical protein